MTWLWLWVLETGEQQYLPESKLRQHPDASILNQNVECFYSLWMATRPPLLWWFNPTFPPYSCCLLIGRLNHWEKQIAPSSHLLNRVIKPKLKISSNQFQPEFHHSLPASVNVTFVRPSPGRNSSGRNSSLRWISILLREWHLNFITWWCFKSNLLYVFG